MSPEDYAAARYEALNERIVDLKTTTDRRVGAIHHRLDRLDERKADKDELEKTQGTLDRVLLAIVAFSLTVAGSAAIYVLQLKGSA